MKSNFKKFKTLNTQDKDMILKTLNINEEELYKLLKIWINQSLIPKNLPLFLEVRRCMQQKNAFHNQKNHQNEMQTFKRLIQEKHADTYIAQQLHCSQDRIYSLKRQWYNRLYREGLSQEQICLELNESNDVLAEFKTAFENREREKAFAVKKRLLKNQYYSKKHLENFQDYYIFDLEANQSPDEIIEIAVIDFQGTIMFNSLVSPEHHLDYHIRKLTGINDRMLNNQPCIDEIMEELAPLVAGKTLMSWGLDYDQRLIKKSCIDTGINLDCNLVCAQKIYMGLRGMPNQVSLCHAAGYESQDHRALSDCFMVLDICKKIENKTDY